jgi:hypothetical protein
MYECQMVIANTTGKNIYIRIVIAKHEAILQRWVDVEVQRPS